MLVLFISGVFVWAKRLAPSEAMAVTLLTAINVGVLYYFRRSHSEVIFMPLLIWSTIALNHLSQCRIQTRTWLLPLSLIALLYLGIVRQAGLALPAGFGLMMLHLAIKRQISWRWAIGVSSLIGLSCLGATLWLIEYDQAMAQDNPNGMNYLEQLLDTQSSLAGQIAEGLRLRIQSIGRTMLPGAFKLYGSWLNPCMLLYLPLCYAIGRGVLGIARFKGDVLFYAFAFYLGLYIIWPFDQGCRFMVPFVPLFALGLIQFIKERLGESKAKPILIWLTLACGITALIYQGRDIAKAIELDPHWASLEKINQQVPMDQTLGSTLSSRDINLMARVVRDRLIPHVKPNESVPQTLNYLLTDQTDSTRPGFTEVFTSGPCSLLQRTP